MEIRILTEPPRRGEVGSILLLSLILALPAQALELNIEVEPSAVKQGQTLVVLVESPGRLREITGKFLDREVKFYPWGHPPAEASAEADKYRGIFGVDLQTPEGKQWLSVRVTDAEGKTEIAEKAVEVIKGKFKTEWFTLPPTKTKLLAPEIIAVDWEKISRIITRESEEQIWYGKFKLPLGGRISMPFGTYQFINRKPSGQHRGVDISGRLGTPIRAANHGKVVLAEKLQAFGNTVVLDHGQGIFTLYLHLSKIKVKGGERASGGQVIGGVGASGVSSGPHLHFGLSVHDVRVDPMEWVSKLRDPLVEGAQFAK